MLLRQDHQTGATFLSPWEALMAPLPPDLTHEIACMYECMRAFAPNFVICLNSFGTLLGPSRTHPTNLAKTCRCPCLCLCACGFRAQGLLTFPELRDVVGFDDYYAEEERYKLK